MFGTLAVGIFGVKGLSGLPLDGLINGGGFAQLIIQAKGVVVVGAFTFVLSFAAWYALKLVMGIRVKAEDEINGLDVAEIGMEAYPDAMEIEEKVRVAHASVAPSVALGVTVPSAR